MPSHRHAICLFAATLLSVPLLSFADPAPVAMPDHGGMQPQYRQTLKAQRAACLQTAAQQKVAAQTLKQTLSQCRKG